MSSPVPRRGLRAPLPAGTIRFNTPLPGYSSPQLPRNNPISCSAGLRSGDRVQFLPCFFRLSKAQAGAAPHALPQPAPGRASPVPGGPDGKGFLLPGAGLGSIAPPGKVCPPGVSFLRD